MDPAYPRCFWIELEDAPAGASVHAAVSGNAIEIRSADVRRLRLFLDGKLVDLAKEVVVRINGREAFRGLVRSSAGDLLFSLARTADAQEAYGAVLELGVF